MRCWVLLFLLASGCDIGAWTDCRTACREIFHDNGCALTVDGIGGGTAVTVCSNECAGAEDAARAAWVDCVATSTCEQLEDNECPADMLQAEDPEEEPDDGGVGGGGGGW